MKWTNPITGALFTIPAVIFLYCLPETSNAGFIQVGAPKITSVCRSKSGKQITWSCRVDPGLLREETVVYWLVNDSFVESAFPSERVQTSTNNSMDCIQSDLIFHSVQDYQNNSKDVFTCVALNPAGMDTKILPGVKQSKRGLCNNRNREGRGKHLH